MQKRFTIAGNGTNDNLLQGSQWEYLPFDAKLNFGINGDANAIDLRVDVYSGQDVLLEDGMINVKAAFPIYPDDFPLADVAGAGERVKVRVRNLNAATRDVWLSLLINRL